MGSEMCIRDRSLSDRDLGCVVEDAVERNPWGKSRSDRMCRFPNTGGLHRTSEDAHWDLRNLDVLHRQLDHLHHIQLCVCDIIFSYHFNSFA